jgi:hypothetical protein
VSAKNSDSRWFRLPLSLLMLASGLRFAMNVLSSAAKPAMTENVLLF